MAEETFREFVARRYTEFDTGKHSRNKDIADWTVDNNDVNTSLAGTLNNYGCQSLQGNIIMNEEILTTLTLNTTPKEIQSNKHHDNYLMTILSV